MNEQIEQYDLKCEENCEHSLFEHTAFDEGFAAGAEGGHDAFDSNPYTDGELREIWFIGHSAGVNIKN